MLNKEITRETIFTMLSENDQNPIVVKSPSLHGNTDTLIETKDKGVFYVLEYGGTGRIGWSLAFSRLDYLQTCRTNYAIIFIDSVNSQIFVVFDDDKKFYSQKFSQPNDTSYRVENNQVLDWKISLETLDYYFAE